MMFEPKIKVKGVGDLAFGKYIALLAIHHQQTDPERRLGKDGASGETGNAVADGEYTKDGVTDHNDQHGIYTLITLMHTLYRLGSDPKLLGLQTRMVQSNRVDYSDISKYLHLAEFTPDHVILLDKVPSQRLAMHYGADDLVGLLCWLVMDIDAFLGKDAIYKDELPSEVGYLAETFAERYLTSDQQLFLNDNDLERQVLIDQLLHIFNEIMRFHPPVDAQTQEVGDAIEAYLTHAKTQQALSDGKKAMAEAHLGSEMYDVWEMLCLDFELVALLKDWEVLIVDAGNLPKGLMDRLDNKLLALTKHPHFDKSHQKLYFDGKRPDLVLYQEKDNIVTYRIIDFKYYDFNKVKEVSKTCKDMEEDRHKLKPDDAYSFYCDECKNDIQKSQSYAFGVQRFHMEKYYGYGIEVSLEFWVAADDQPDNSIVVFNPYQCLVPKPINKMIEKTLEHKAFAR